VRPRLQQTLLHIVLLGGAVVTLLPIVWMFSASLMPTGQATTYPPRFFPSHVTFEHYAVLFTRLSLGRYFLNSSVIAGAATICSLLFNSMAGYALAKLTFPGRGSVYRLLLAGLVVPAQVTMLPLFLLLRAMGLVNTYVGAIVPAMATIFGIFLIRQYALSIPDDLLDAARLDGASEFRVYWSVALPAMRPVLATLAIFTFLSTWNDFLWPLFVLSNDSRYTLPVALANLAGEHVEDTELMMAGSVLTVLPVVVLFLLLQRHYIEGIMAGSAKG
jgi:multiple sugar transport system permease protein